MSYILGAFVVIMAAYIASLQGEISHYKARIKSLNIRNGSLLRANLQCQEDLEKNLHELDNMKNDLRQIKEMEGQK